MVALDEAARFNAVSPSGLAVCAGDPMKIITLFAGVLLVGALGWPVRAETESKGYACVFDMGNTWTYNDGSFKTKPSAPLTFEIVDIDLKGQSAHLRGKGDRKAGSVKIVRAINANHFLEVVNEGFLNLTTVYDVDPKTGKSPAVHSRHLGVIGQPVFAQYAGTCTAK